MRMITATQANSDFAMILERVAGGEAVGITKRGVVFATMNPAKKASFAKRETLKHRFLEELRARKPFAYVTARGTRAELYED